MILICIENKAAYNLALLTNVESIERNEKLQLAVKGVKERFRLTTKMFNTRGIEPYRVCRRVNILRDYPDDKIKIYP